MEKTTILDDIKTLKAFAQEAQKCGPDSVHARERGGNADVLRAVGRVFAPTRPTGMTVAPEVARAELAALPVPRKLWDDVLEPLLAMAERATMPAAAEAPLTTPAQKAMRDIREIIDEHDLAWGATKTTRAELHAANPEDFTGWMQDVVSFVATWAGILSEVSKATACPGDFAGVLPTMRELLQVAAELGSLSPGLAKLQQAAGADSRPEALKRAMWCVDVVTGLCRAYGLPEGWDHRMPASCLAVAEEEHHMLVKLRELAGTEGIKGDTVLLRQAQIDQDNRGAMKALANFLRLGEASRSAVAVAIDLLERLRNALVERGYARVMQDGRTEVEVLCTFARECPRNYAEGHTPEITAVLEAVESLFSRPAAASRPLSPDCQPYWREKMSADISREIDEQVVKQGTFSEQLEALRRTLTRFESPHGTVELLAWAEMMERQLVATFERAGGRSVAHDDPAVALQELLDVIDAGGGPVALIRGAAAPCEATYGPKLQAAIEVAKAALSPEPAPDDEVPEVSVPEPLEPAVGQRVRISDNLIWRTNLTREARAARAAGAGIEGVVQSHLVGHSGPLTCEVMFNDSKGNTRSAHYVPEELAVIKQIPDPAQGA